MAHIQLRKKAPHDQPFTPTGTATELGPVTTAFSAPQCGHAGADSWISLPQPLQKTIAIFIPPALRLLPFRALRYREIHLF
jgi:hypothetical protein